MTNKEVQWIRLNHISKIAKSILDRDIIDKQQIKQLDIEISAMLKVVSSHKRFFKRLS